MYGNGDTPPRILNMGGLLDVTALRSDCFTPCIFWVGDYVGSRAGLDMVAKRKVLVPAGNRTSDVEPVAMQSAV